jgi:DNA-binding GntR family transcriptional regulator
MEANESLIDTRLLVGGLCANGDSVEEVAARFGVPAGTAGETLDSLVAGGHLERAGDGTFRVAPLDEDELRELYVVSMLLEGLALRTSPPFDEKALAGLRDANERLARAVGDTAAAVAADDDFHAALVNHSGNDELCRTHRQAHQALIRYERFYYVGEDHIRRSTSDHERIIAALEAGDHEAAVAAVRANYEGSLPD